MNLSDFIESRHSVRQYLDRPVESEKRAVLDELIAQINRESGLHLQIFYDEPTCFDSFRARYGKFSGVKNYIAAVGEKGADFEEKVGYYTEKAVLTAQSLGLNTCWVALTHGKSKAKVGKGEKAGCLIAFGYGETQGVSHTIKTPQDVSNCAETDSEAFLRGVNAALLAPTAMNQQKFFFRLNSDGTVSARAGKGFYTKTDLGIAKYHFELASGLTVRTEPN